MKETTKGKKEIQILKNHATKVHNVEHAALESAHRRMVLQVHYITAMEACLNQQEI